MVTAQEYKRKCKSCGKVWHSLKSMEDSLKSDQNFNYCLQGIQAGTGNAHKAASEVRRTDIRNVQSNISSLKKCPDCGSSNYTEELVTFER